MGGLRLHGGLGRQGDKTTSVERLKNTYLCQTSGATPEPRRWSRAVYGPTGLHRCAADARQILEVWRLHKWEAMVSPCWRQGHKGPTMRDLIEQED